jgi:hypothetical protein
MIRNFFCLLLIAVINLNIQCQDICNGSKAIAVGAGINYLQIKDRLVSPAVSSGFVQWFEIYYNNTNEVFSQKVQLNVSAGHVSDNNISAKSFYLASGLNYSFAARIKSSNPLYIGAAVGLECNSDFPYQLDEEHTYWMNNYYLAAYGRYTIPFDRENFIEITLRVPVVEYLSRPPLQRFYKSDEDGLMPFLRKIHNNMHLHTLNKYQSFDLTAEYRFTISKNLSEIIAYRCHYINFSEPARITQLEHLINLNVVYRF